MYGSERVCFETYELAMEYVNLAIAFQDGDKTFTPAVCAYANTTDFVAIHE